MTGNFFSETFANLDKYLNVKQVKNKHDKKNFKSCLSLTCEL